METNKAQTTLDSITHFAVASRAFIANSELLDVPVWAAVSYADERDEHGLKEAVT
jgi:hypothetical protein